MVRRDTAEAFRARRFLVDIATLLPREEVEGIDSDPGVEGAARQLARFLRLKLEQGDVDAVLETLENGLESVLERERHEVRSFPVNPAGTPRDRTTTPRLNPWERRPGAPRIDPYFWG